MRGLAGKRIIVASGATGIGAATAMRLAEEGARVVVGDINVAEMEKTVAAIVEKGGEAHGIRFDLADEPSIHALITNGVTWLGGLDGLANIGAYIAGSKAELNQGLREMDVGLWETSFRINTLGHALTIRAALPHMAASGGGAIVGISSGAAYLGLPTLPAYATTKLALHALARHVAATAGKDGIRCNLIAPGWILTDTAVDSLDEDGQKSAIAAIPLTRLGRPGDIAGAVAYLMSDDGEWITGQVLAINGGAEFRD